MSSSSSAEELLEQFQVEKATLTQSLQHLQQLLQRMQSHHESFDEEDQQLVKEWIGWYQSQLEILQSEIASRQELYLGTVKRMERALDVRMQVLQELDEETSVLEQHPELMEKLASKQATLTEMLELMKAKLAAPIGTGLPTADESSVPSSHQ